MTPGLDPADLPVRRGQADAAARRELERRIGALERRPAVISGGGGGGGAPSGPAGGVLGGSYPNPGFASDMATQAELDAAVAAKQPLDSDLTAIAAIAPSNDDVIQRKSGVWVARSMAQVKADLALTKADVGLGSVDNTADTAKPVSTPQQTALNLKQDAATAATDAELAAHEADTTAVHGIPDTATLVYTGDARLSDARTPTAHTHAEADVTGLVADLAAKQPLDSDLTAIAALATTAFGRALLTEASAASARGTLGTDAAGATRPPSGAAGGVLSGTYPDPGFAVDMATQTELDAVAAAAQPLDADLTAIAALATTAYGRSFLALADAAAARALTGAAAAAHTHAQADITNLVTDLAAKQPLDSDLTAIAALATTATGRSLLEAADAAAIRTIAAAASAASVPNASYRSLLDCSGSHIAARVAGTYGFAQSQPLAITGTGILYPLNTIYIAGADYPTLDGVAPKLRVRAQLYVNDVAPTGNFTFGLHPITRPAVSGGAGLVIYTIGAAVAGSTAAINTPAADSSNFAVGADFAVPADGHYVLGVVTTATVAASSHLHMSAILQMRNA